MEPVDIWECHVASEDRALAKWALWHQFGEHQNLVVLNGRPLALPSSLIPRPYIWRPGTTPEQIGSLDPAGAHPVDPDALSASGRLRVMDDMGVDVAVILPTLFGEHLARVEYPKAAVVLARAYNQWIHEWCGEDRERLFPAGVLPLQDIDAAVEEVHRISDLGFRSAVVNPVFIFDRYLNHPDFDPVWGAIEQEGIVATILPFAGIGAPEWSSHGPFIDRVTQTAQIGHPVSTLFAPMMDAATALTALFYYGHFERYPALRLSIANARASWLPLALEKSEGYITQGASTTLPIRPDSDRLFFERAVGISFDTGEQVVERLWDDFQSVAMWGSRYPSHDTSPPTTEVDRLRALGVPSESVTSMMGGNALRLYRLQGVTNASPQV